MSRHVPLHVAILCLINGMMAVGVPGGVASAAIIQVGQINPVPGAGNDYYGDVWGQTINGTDYAFVGSFGGRGVAIVDLQSPSAPALATHFNPIRPGTSSTNEVFKDVKVVGDVGYFASDNGGGVYVVGLANPASPTTLSRITSATPGGGFNSIHNISVENGFLYEADSRTGVVKVFDVSDPTTPTHVQDIAVSSGRIHDVTALNGKLYTSDLNGQTAIYDVSNVGTTGAASLGSFASGGSTHSNWVTPDGQHLVSARETSNGDIRIYNISDPMNVLLEASIDRSTIGIDAFSPHNPVVMGDLLYVSWYQAGLQVFDISDPTNPLYLDGFDTFPGVGSTFDGNWGVYPFLGTDRVLLSDLDSGLFIVDASSVPEPSTLLLVLLAAGLGSGYCRLRRRSTQRPS